MDNDFERLLGNIQAHFTPSELMEFLGLEWEVLLDNNNVLDIIEERMDDLKEEIGLE